MIRRTAGQAGKDVLIEALITQPADQTLGECVLHRLAGRNAGRNVVPADAAIHPVRHSGEPWRHFLAARPIATCPIGMREPPFIDPDIGERASERTGGSPKCDPATGTMRMNPISKQHSTGQREKVV